MTADDRPIGRLLTRREALAVLGAGAFGVLVQRPPLHATQARGACVARPQQTEGPYFVDAALNRSDIRLDPSDGSIAIGTPLALTIAVSRLEGTGGGGTCKPVAGAHVDLWHSDHRGIYSDVQDPGFDTRGKKFLRGYQLTGPDGLATFATIYPGWYQGRTVHVHFKIRTAPAADRGTEFTSQIYFDDALSDEVFAREPYAARGARRTRNPNDGIFRGGGAQLLLPLERRGEGYAGVFEVALAP
jgi:protocatechuate 3,4-dioxygenase beta subunit